MRKFLLLFLLVGYATLIAAQEAGPNKVKRLQKQKLTYYYSAPFCPDFIDTYTAYGFRIRCVGCMVGRRKKSRNERVIKKLNEAYGESWFEKQFESFHINRS
jgi:hypothetical protein